MTITLIFLISCITNLIIAVNADVEIIDTDWYPIGYSSHPILLLLTSSDEDIPEYRDAAFQNAKEKQLICCYDGSCYETFNNKNEMDKVNKKRRHISRFRIVSNHQCVISNQPQCPICPETCPNHLKPICAFDGDCYQTFPNSCYMNYQNCWKKGPEFYYWSTGLCEENDEIANRICED